jgi:hypothetical protein
MSNPNLPYQTHGASQATALSQSQRTSVPGLLTPDQMRLMLVLERFSKDPFSDEHRVCQD